MTTEPAEQGLTVESALIELRQMFPEERRISIEVSDFTQQQNSVVIAIGFNAGISMRFSGETLADAMRAVNRRERS